MIVAVYLKMAFFSMFNRLSFSLWKMVSPTKMLPLTRKKSSMYFLVVTKLNEARQFQRFPPMFVEMCVGLQNETTKEYLQITVFLSSSAQRSQNTNLVRGTLNYCTILKGHGQFPHHEISSVYYFYSSRN